MAPKLAEYRRFAERFLAGKAVDRVVHSATERFRKQDLSDVRDPRKLFFELLSSEIICVMYTGLRDRALQLAWRLLADSNDAQEAVQAAAAALLKRGLQGVSNVEGLFIHILYQTIVDILRDRRRRRAQWERYRRDVFPWLVEGAVERDSQHFDKYREHLGKALEALPKESREILVLHYFQDLQLRKIADLLGLPLNTVKSRARRARESLRDLLDPPGEGGGHGARDGPDDDGDAEDDEKP